MKKLSKADITRLGDLDVHLMAAAAALEAYISNQFTEAVAEYNNLVVAYNERLVEARGVLEDFSSEIESYMDERSEKWQEGDAAAAFTEWKDAIDNIGYEMEELEELPEPEVPEFCASLEDNVPQEPSL